MEEDQPRKRRRPNFSDEEILALVIAVSKNQDILFGKFHLDIGSTASSLKTTAWENVTDAVNGISEVRRNTDEVRKKYKHFKSEVKKKKANEKKHLKGTDARLAKRVYYTPAEKALLNLLAEQSAVGSSEVPCLNDVELAVEEKEEPHSPVSGEHLVRPSSPAPVMGLPAEEPGPSTSVLTTETSAPVSPTTNHLSSRHRGSRRTLSQRRRQLPNHQGTMEDMLGVQRQIRDLLQDLNNTVATGFRDIAAAIRYVADKGSHT